MNTTEDNKEKPNVNTGPDLVQMTSNSEYLAYETTKKKDELSEMNDEPLIKKLKERDALKNCHIVPVLTTLILGIIFGFFLQRARVFEPEVIRDQFRFKRFIMLKMFLAASGTSAIVIGILSIFFPKYFLFARSKSNSCTNFYATMIGGLLLGIGMYLSGACPGMVLIQVGSGVKHSMITFIGALFGAFIYGMIEPFFRKYYNKYSNFNLYIFVDQFIKIINNDKYNNNQNNQSNNNEPKVNYNYAFLAITTGILIFIVVMIFEILFPWKEELTINNDPNCNIINCQNYQPSISGMVIGLLQVPCILILGNTLGGATAYVCITGQWTRFLSESKQEFYNHFKGALNRYWQVLYICSAIIGSMIALYLAKNNLNHFMDSFDFLLRSFIGGIVMIFGARLAKGCTSGHGLSGIGLLCTLSFIAVGFMFIGGAIAALIDSAI